MSLPSGPPEQYSMWLAILKWSLAQTDGTTDSSNHQEMKEEDKLFLKNVFQELTKDEPDRMRVIITKIYNLLQKYPAGRHILSSCMHHFSFHAL